MEDNKKQVEEKVEEVKTEEVKTKPEVNIADLKKLYKVIEEQNQKIEQLSKTKQVHQENVSPYKTKKTEAPVEKEKEQRVPTIQKTEEPKVEKYSDCINGVFVG